MELVKQFLKKFSQLTLPDDTLKRLFVELVEQDFGLKIERDQLTFRNGVLLVNVSPALKSELYLRKNKILAKLKEGLGAKAPQDIR